MQSTATQEEQTMKTTLTSNYIRILAILAVLVPLAAALGSIKING
jgi:hypothetical protein